MGVLTRRSEFLAGYTPPPPSNPTLVNYTESTQDATYSTAAAITVASSLSWASGDVVVVAWGGEDGAISVAVDNETNLTFTAVSAAAGAAGTSCSARMYYSVATGAGSGTISGTVTHSIGSPSGVQLSAWHWTDCSGIGNTSAAAVTGTTSTRTMSASVNSAVVTAWFDYSAEATPWTGEPNTGTLTERLENQHTGRFSMWAGDWIGTSAGSDGWGTTDGTGQNLTFAGAVEVLT